MSPAGEADGMVPTINGLFSYELFGQTLWITTTHVTLFIVLVALLSLAFIAHHKIRKNPDEVPGVFQNILELIVEKLDSLGEKVIFLGDGVPVFRSVIEECAKVPFSFAPENMLVQRAGSLGLRGIQLFKEGKAVNAADHAPDYLRPSQAERVRNEASKHDD